MKKAKGKAIIGIAMAAIMVASVMVAMVPTATAVAPGLTVDKKIDKTTLGTPVNYIFTTTNSNTFADTLMIAYSAAPAGWAYSAAPAPQVMAPGGSVTWTLTVTPPAVQPPVWNPSVATPTVAVTNLAGEATSMTVGCYLDSLTYNGLELIIIADPPFTPLPMATTTLVIIGQDLAIVDLFGVPYANVEIKGDPTSAATAGQIFMADSRGKFDSEAMTVEGTYYIKPVGGTSVATPVSCEGILAVTTPTMNLDLRAGGTSVSSITQGTPLQIHFTNNLDQNDMVTLKIIDPNGNQIKSTPIPAQQFSKINVLLIRDVYGVAGIDTTNWKIGTYTFQVKTDKTVADGIGARGLDASSNEKTLTIRPSEIEISAETTTVVEDESVRLTVTGVTGHVVRIDSSNRARTVFPDGLDNNPPGNTPSTPAGVIPFTDTIDVDGKRTYAVEFFDTGAYTITVTDTTTVPQMTDTVDITVCPKAVTFDMPATVALGEKLTIKGTANTGDLVAIAFDNMIPQGYGHLTIDEDGEFSKEINTGINSQSAKLKTPGSVRVKAFINWMLPAGATFPYDASDLVDDGTTMILLAPQSLTAELSGSEVALDDSFIIRGTANGPRCVEILTVSPKGVSGNGLRAAPGIYGPPPANTPYTGCTYDRTAVSETDHTFSKKLDVRENADTGSYMVAVLSSGIDGQYGHNLGHNLQDALNNGYGDISAKTQKQVLSILEEMTTAAGSDDLMWIGYIKIGKPHVTLEPMPDVQVGEPLGVTGSTNRGEGMTIVITVEGPKKLPPGVVSVKNNKFTAVFDTTGIPLGTYTVTADDGDDHTDTTTVNVIKAKISASIATNKVKYSPGDVMTTSIHLLNPTDKTQNLLFKWYLEIPGYNFSTKIMETEVHLAADSDLTFAIPIPVGNWGAESFCGYHIASLADTTTKKVVSVDSTAWIYVPRGVSESKTTAEITKEIEKAVEGVEFGGERGKNGNKNESER